MGRARIRAASIAWIIERFTPLLLAQARYRRALKKLRGLLGESIFDELPQE